MSRRILITGSRAWADHFAIETTLEAFARPGDIVVHGDCPTGADRIAKDWAERNGIHQEAHPADWQRRGRGAGPIRNQQMVDLGADWCFAFPLPGSRGTEDCMRRAQHAGIQVQVVAPRAPGSHGRSVATQDEPQA